MSDRPTFILEDDPDGTSSMSPLVMHTMTDEEYEKFKNKKAARRLQKETGMKYTEALRQVQQSKENN